MDVKMISTYYIHQPFVVGDVLNIVQWHAHPAIIVVTVVTVVSVGSNGGLHGHNLVVG